ncbi:uncharacterized protein Bfra_001540 [Botrytis fragariae]|uniref:Uncharacterized protein n=1 Tax=Botrytis fragariae TaxID=1964551 RepID=A0A8H6B152_9HELO|nr:uncharacterized protein Bfra_001540 [Botrytis fragariae]KAF5877177.1 hypothetical protein Bfra_001540 [Botrytis fragariae]
MCIFIMMGIFTLYQDFLSLPNGFLQVDTDADDTNPIPIPTRPISNAAIGLSPPKYMKDPSYFKLPSQLFVIL